MMKYGKSLVLLTDDEHEQSAFVSTGLTEEELAAINSIAATNQIEFVYSMDAWVG